MTEQSPKTPPTRNWFPSIAYLTIVLLLLIINVKMVSPYILSILMGGVLAILLFPFYHKLREHKIGPLFSSGLITVAFTLIIIIPLTFFAIAATNQANIIAKKMSENQSLSVDSVAEKVSNWKFVRTFVEDGEDLKAQLTKTAQGGIDRVTKLFLGIVGAIPDSLLLLLLTLLSLFFLLIDGRKFLNYLNDMIQLDQDVRNKLQHAFKNTSISVVWASLAASTAQSLLMLITFAILKVPGSFLAAGATFILSWIPFLGSLPVWLIGSVYLFMNDRIPAMIIMLILGMFTSVIDNYIRPLILKGRDEMHPLVSLVAIFGGINMFGVTGVIFGPVFAASLISLLQIWPTVGKRLGFKIVHHHLPPDKDLD